MPTPFPGMDPYLERRGLWEEVHTHLIVGIQHYLTPLLRPKYRVAVEHRTYLALLPPPDQRVGIPDVLVTAGGSQSSSEVAANLAVAEPVVGELPMPEEVVEIDLLRAGQPLEMKLQTQNGADHSDYGTVVSRSWQRSRADLYLLNLRDPIPTFAISLRRGETEAALPLNQILHELYDQGSYDLAIDYGQPPEPPLDEGDAEWAAIVVNAQRV